MRSRRLLPFGVAILGLVASFGLATSRPPLEPTPVPDRRPFVAVAIATPTDTRVTVRSQGSVEPRTEIDLAAEASGRIALLSPALETGGYFSAGEVLVELDPRDAEVSLERSQAAFDRSEIELRQAGVVLDRLRALASGSVASAAQREDAEYTLELARARRREARAALVQAQRALAQTRIPAPFAGRVRSVRVDVGQFIARGEAIARIFSERSVEVRLPIPDDQLPFLDLPPSAPDGMAEGGPRVSFSALFVGAARRWAGRIVRLEAAIDDESRMIHAVARFDAPSAPTNGQWTAADLPAVGLFVEAEIEGRPLVGVVALPREALRGDASAVLVIDAEGFVVERSVTVARVDRDEVVIQSGLEPGEQVCVSPTPPAVGLAVRPVEIPPTTDHSSLLATSAGAS